MSPVITKKKFGNMQLLITCMSIIVLGAVLTSIFAPVYIPTSSMEPTIEAKSFVFCKFIDGDDLQYDDIIILYKDRAAPKFKNAILCNIGKGKPENFSLCKRVIGLAGDVIEVRDGYVWRNGEKLDPNYLTCSTDGVFEPYTVPEGCVFCMGDNRNYSADSRLYGAFPIENVLAKVIIK